MCIGNFVPLSFSEEKYDISSENKLCVDKSDRSYFIPFFFQLEFRCHIGGRTQMDGNSNGTKSDNPVSIQKIGSQTWSDYDHRFSHETPFQYLIRKVQFNFFFE